MNVGGVDYSGSVNTNLLTASVQFPSGTVNNSGNPLISSTFSGLNPENPFYRIFAGECIAVQDVNAYLTQFVFSLGGVPCGNSQWMLWGPASELYTTSLKLNPTQGLIITPQFGEDSFNVHSQYAGICGVIGAPDPGNAYGFLTRWTARADACTVKTYAVQPANPLPAKAEIFHGFVQQPF